MNYRSIVISSGYFAAALFASTYVVEPVLNHSQVLGFILVLFVWCSPGYLAAAIAQHHAVLHASVAGALSCLLAIAATYAFKIGGFTSKLGYTWLFYAVVSFGFGALIWSLKSWVSKRNA